MSDRAMQLLTRGTAAAKANDLVEAKFYLEWVLRSDANQSQKVEAWLWLSQVSNKPQEKRDYLELVLAHQPTHALARRQLAVLDGRLKPEEVVNPNKLPVTPDQTSQRSQVQQIYCPRCSSRMVFTADGSHLHCEHCAYDEGLSPQQSTASNQSLENKEQDFIVTMATAKGHLRPVVMQTFDCQRCGHGFWVDPKTISVSCPYCGSLYVVKEISLSARQLIPPQALVPFAVNREQAERQIGQWFKQKRIGEGVVVHGVYLPAWTFDLGGVLSWRGYVENRYERRPVSGEYPVHLDDLLVPALRHLPPGVAEELPHFNLQGLVPYDPRFLANWVAELYDLPVGDASLQARKKGLSRLRTRVEASLTESVEGLQLVSAGMTVESYKLILLPLWLANFTHKAQSITLFINGQTAKLHTHQQKIPQTSTKKPLSWMERLHKWLRDE